MNQRYKLVIAVMMLAASGLSAAPESFFRPILSSVRPDADEYSNAIGFGIATGLYLGTKGNHELSFEWGHSRWDSDGSEGGISYAGRETYMPYVVNYRFHIKPSDNYSIYVGPSAGISITRVEASVVGSGIRYEVSDTNWGAALGVTGGVLLKLTSRIDLDLGYRYIRLQGIEHNIGGFTYSTGDSGARAIYAGVGLRF